MYAIAVKDNNLLKSINEILRSDEGKQKIDDIEDEIEEEKKKIEKKKL
ncbi:MAG: hypothetical protein GY941_10070 [Planctomycetes bacterium]|nr:hypothetical protein [Planctomycetota bacterium]